jgi:hypothetical protein
MVIGAAFFVVVGQAFLPVEMEAPAARQARKPVPRSAITGPSLENLGRLCSGGKCGCRECFWRVDIFVAIVSVAFAPLPTRQRGGKSNDFARDCVVLGALLGGKKAVAGGS